MGDVMNSVKRIIGCCALVCFLALATAALAETEADRLTAQGDKLLDARKFEEALAVYQQALEGDWEHCGAMYGQGRALFSLGQSAKARKVLEDLMAFCPGERQARLLLGYAQLASGAPREARRTFLKLSETNPRDISALVGLGRAEHEAGNRLAGEQYLRKAQRLQPNNQVLRRLVRRMAKSNRDFLKEQEAVKRRRLVNEFNKAVAEAGAEWSRQYAEERARRMRAAEQLDWEIDTATEFGALWGPVDFRIPLRYDRRWRRYGRGLYTGDAMVQGYDMFWGPSKRTMRRSIRRRNLNRRIYGR